MADFLGIFLNINDGEASSVLRKYYAAPGQLTSFGKFAFWLSESEDTSNCPLVLKANLFNRGELLQKYGLTAEATSAQIFDAMLGEMSLPGALNLLNGSFCGAYYDRAFDSLCLFRDHLGAEFVFYGFDGKGNCWFASRLDYLKQVEGLDWTVDLRALSDYFSVGYIAAPRTIYKNICKVQAASCVRISGGRAVNSRRFWQPRYSPKTEITFGDAVEESRRLLSKAISRCLEFHRDASFLLSGGIDSGLVLSLARLQDLRANWAVSIAFSESLYNESNLAGLVAATNEVGHSLRLLEPRDLFRVDRLMQISGEPFADSSLLATAVATESVAKYDKAVFTGDGGDEVFGGYRRYRLMAMRHGFGPLGSGAMRVIAKIVSGFLPEMSERRSSYSNFCRIAKAMSLAPLPAFAHFQEIYSEDFKRKLLKFSLEEGNYLDDLEKITDDIDVPERPEVYNGVDLLYYMPEDCCRKMNLANIGAGTISMAPLMDMDLVNFVLQLPQSFKFDMRNNKRILRELAKDLLPDEILRQPKRGFGVPITDWLRDDCSEQIREMADSIGQWDDQGWLNHKAVVRMVDDHIFYNIDNGAKLWCLYCLWRWKVGMK